MNSVIFAAAKAGDLTMVKELFQQTLDAGGMTKTMGARLEHEHHHWHQKLVRQYHSVSLVVKLKR